MKFTDVLSSMGAAAIPIIAKGTPESVLFAACLQPILSTGLEAIYLDIFKKGVTRKEAAKLGISYESAVKQANENLSNGLSFRTDGMFTQDPESVIYSDASDIIEATLKSVIDGADRRKSSFYGYFIGNLGFCPEVDYSNAINLHSIVSQLSYTQLCLVCFFYRNNILDLSRCKDYIDSTSDVKALEVYLGIKELDRCNLLKRLPPYSLGLEFQRHTLSANGRLIYKIMSLHKIDNSELSRVESTCWQMGITHG